MGSLDDLEIAHWDHESKRSGPRGSSAFRFMERETSPGVVGPRWNLLSASTLRWLDTKSV
jgi:hypothetical protein